MGDYDVASPQRAEMFGTSVVTALFDSEQLRLPQKEAIRLGFAHSNLLSKIPNINVCVDIARLHVPNDVEEKLNFLLNAAPEVSFERYMSWLSEDLRNARLSDI